MVVVEWCKATAASRIGFIGPEISLIQSAVVSTLAHDRMWQERL